ncbi:MAG: DUF1822 family protein [Leptolyngbyaceae cyanobacterium CRU_2_3]|nr:DUF1822 family protein [Leptolyngbyaceae cyanobacterium CRU_2_3]
MSYRLEFFEPTQVGLEIDATIQAQAWQQSRAFATAASQWNAYVNQLCLQTMLAWLQQDYDPQATSLPNAAALDSYWEVVNGAVIAFAGRRLVLVPSEAIDCDELRVSQEWVDIPNWIGDYYVAVQVNEDEGWLRLQGFTTHRQLKERGRYDWRDRTYCLEPADLIPDFGALWVSRQLAPDEVTRAASTPSVSTPSMATLSTVQAENLIERLSHPTLSHPDPRLAIPFEQWAALMSHGGWRQTLTERRRGLPEQRSLLQWLRSGIPIWASQAGWGQVEIQLAAGGRGEAASLEHALAQRLTIAHQPYELQVAQVDAAANIWRWTLRSLTAGGMIPAGFALRLLTEDLQPFEGNEDRATAAIELLLIEIVLEPGEGIVWEIEPQPDAYEREIFR